MLIKFAKSAEAPVNKAYRRAFMMAVLLTLVNILDCYLLFTSSYLKLILKNYCHDFEINLLRATASKGGDIIGNKAAIL